MMSLGLFDFTHGYREKQERRQREETPAVPWDPMMKWSPYLHIQASTYNPKCLFDTKPCNGTVPTCVGASDQFASKGFGIRNGNWLYMNRVLKKGQHLDTFYGRQRGRVAFDGDVIIPCLFYRQTETPFMSHTPMEVFTLRGGTRLAKGHTIIAGLGLGYQLTEVCKREKVKRVTLVERWQALVDWILPHVNTNGKPFDVIVGDARDVVPAMTADVALIDIYPGYGGNRFRDCPKIPQVWRWGAA